MIRKLLLLAALGTFSLTTFSQEEGSMIPKDTMYLCEKKYPSQYEYEQFHQAFAPKKKSKWSLGLGVGATGVVGEIRPVPSYAISVYGQKGLGHVFSLRLQALYASVKGQDYRKASYDGTYRNYKGYVADLSLQGVFTLNNINFYRKDPKVILYGFAGLGASMPNVKLDLQNAGGVMYDYSGVPSPANYSDRKETLKQIKALRDNTYETAVKDAATTDNFQVRKFVPSLSFGAGVSYKLSKSIDLALEDRISWQQTDYLDGYVINKQGVTTEGSDLLNCLTLAVRFRIGNAMDADWWVNPLYNTYEDLRMLKEKAAADAGVADEDHDGVDDRLDKDLNTPPNALVNTHGVVMDIDRDGVSDNFDKELFSPDGAKVDKNGIAIDTDHDGVADAKDRELKSPENALVDAKGIDVTEATPAKSGNTDFGVIFFDFNSSEVEAQYYEVVYKVADYLKANPNAKISIVGHADNRANDAYNEKLALKRAQNTADILFSAFGFDKARIKVLSQGEKDQFIPNLPDKRDGKMTEALQALNRRVTFSLQ